MRSFTKLLSGGGAAADGLMLLHQGFLCFEKTFEQVFEHLIAS